MNSNSFKLAVSVILIACVAGGHADVLVSWGDGVAGTDYDWDSLTNELEILRGNGNDYKFWVHDGSEDPNTGVIDNITVDPNAVGDFTLLIGYPLDPNDPNSAVDPNQPGALDWNEGDLRYDNGTSTVTGVSVAGNLGEQDEWIHIERLDGSIDVGGSVEYLEIGEWQSASPASIQVAGDAHCVTLYSSCPGDILVNGDLLGLTLYGDLSGTLDVGGYGAAHIHGDVSGSIDIAGQAGLSIYGDVLDSGDNHVRIGTLGGFQCDNMELSDDSERWLTFGPQPGPIDGNVTIDDTLSGVMHFRGGVYREGMITVGTIDAGPQSHPQMQYGGIYFEAGSGEGCRIWIPDSFKRGWIFGENAQEVAGRIRIDGDIGQQSPPTVAQILTGYAATVGNPPTLFGWEVLTRGDIWPNADGLPVIYSSGDFVGPFTSQGEAMPGVVVQMDGDVLGSIVFSQAPMAGELLVGGDVHAQIGMPGIAPSGLVHVDGDLDAGLWVRTFDHQGAIEVIGDVLNQIVLDRVDLDGGRIHVYGSLAEGALISADGITDSSAVVVDYDGWQEQDRWEGVIEVDDVEYTENTPELNLWEVQPYKGDLTNDGGLGLDDADVLWDVVNEPGYDYGAEFPGLEGSLAWHGDLDCLDGINQVDVGALAFFAKDPPCCLYDAECTEYQSCRADLDRTGDVGLNDLSVLLGTYGLCEGDPGFNPDADFDNDACVELADLNFLLAVYGDSCGGFAACGLARDGEGGSGGGNDGEGAGAGVTVEAFDTGGFEGEGFAGESEDFVFELTVELLDDAGDWTASGVAVQAASGANFRLAAEPTLADPLASFVCAPQSGDEDDDDTPDAGTFVAGAFTPPSRLYCFEPELIDLCWFDRVASFGGPAAIMRLVLDVSEVVGADVSEGFGSVYFSQSGPREPADILVAELQSATATGADGAATSVLTGQFYVRGSAD